MLAQMTISRFKARITKVDVPARWKYLTVWFVNEHNEEIWKRVWGPLHLNKFQSFTTMLLEAIGEQQFRSGEFYNYGMELKRVCERFKGDVWMTARRQTIIDKKGYDKEIWQIETLEPCGQVDAPGGTRVEAYNTDAQE